MVEICKEELTKEIEIMSCDLQEQLKTEQIELQERL